jgi:Zn-dependent alcohol dehydrogenase
VVARVGPGVIHFKEGDEVICQPSGYCGYCKHCRTGNTHYWEWGTQGTQTVCSGD